VRAQHLPLKLIFNKDAVMVLPPGVDKGSGLRAALEELGCTTDDVVAVGDAENDLALFQAAKLKVAVANALPQLQANADWVTSAARGEGVRELVERLLGDAAEEGLAPAP
jgi:hydroxymethylpyrimidine pyrophosphatase-like HAD family hydrolase